MFICLVFSVYIRCILYGYFCLYLCLCVQCLVISVYMFGVMFISCKLLLFMMFIKSSTYREINTLYTLIYCMVVSICIMLYVQYQCLYVQCLYVYMLCLVFMCLVFICLIKKKDICKPLNVVAEAPNEVSLCAPIILLYTLCYSIYICSYYHCYPNIGVIYCLIYLITHKTIPCYIYYPSIGVLYYIYYHPYCHMCIHYYTLLYTLSFKHIKLPL